MQRRASTRNISNVNFADDDVITALLGCLSGY